MTDDFPGIGEVTSRLTTNLRLLGFDRVDPEQYIARYAMPNNPAGFEVGIKYVNNNGREARPNEFHLDVNYALPEGMMDQIMEDPRGHTHFLIEFYEDITAEQLGWELTEIINSAMNFATKEYIKHENLPPERVVYFFI